MTRIAEWLRRNVVLVVLADVVLGLVVFGVQTWQIQLIHENQTQLVSQQNQIILTKQKDDCWSGILDRAIKNPPRTPEERTHLTMEAKRCVSLP